MTCILCDNYFSKDCTQFEIYYTSTSHTNTLLINFIKKVLNWDVNETESKFLCQLCFTIFEQLDFAELQCTRLRKQLTERSILNRYNNFIKDNSTQTTFDTDDKFEFHDTLLESLKSESIISKSPESDINDDFNDVCGNSNSIDKDKESVKKKIKSHECKYCLKKYSSKGRLNLHLQRHHQDDKNIKDSLNDTQENTIKLECDVMIDNECLKTEPEPSDSLITDENIDNSSTRTRLKTGKKKTGSVIKPLRYSCPQCPKMWRTMGELRSHIGTHSNLRPYICEVCGQAYKHKQALDIHVGMHNGINPFSCNYCHKAFTQKGALQRHLPIHTGEAPYQVKFLHFLYS